MSTNKDSLYQTSQFYLACFLLAKGMQIININRDNPKRCEFIFLDHPQREAYIQAFNYSPEDSPECLLDIRKVISAIKMAKDKLYQE